MTICLPFTAFLQSSRFLKSYSGKTGIKISSLFTPCSESFSTTYLPRKPDPPVTKIFLSSKKFIRLQKIHGCFLQYILVLFSLYTDGNQYKIRSPPFFCIRDTLQEYCRKASYNRAD